MPSYTDLLNLYMPNRNDNVSLDTTLTDNFLKIDNKFNDIESNGSAKSPYDTDETVTVGVSGDFVTINEALESLTKKQVSYKKNGLQIEIRLLSGFVMKEQVSISGMNLNWITITSVDDVVTVDRNSITEVLIESRKPIFFGTNGAFLPVIGVQFSYNAGTETNCDGVTVAFGSTVMLLPESGVDNGERGLGAYYSSLAFCYMEGLTEGGEGTGAGEVKGVSFQNCTNRAFMASYGSRINCARSQLQNSTGDYGVYVIWSSFADLYQSDISGATGTAVCSRDGSKVNARDTNVSNSNRGYHALHGATINARYYANIWSGDGAKNCSEYGVLASNNGFIEAPQLPVDGSNIGVHASNGSIVNFYDGTAIGCITTAIYALRASSIDATNVNANDCGNYGFYANEASSISASNSTADRCNSGYYATRASTISAHDAHANDAINNGFVAEHASKISADYGIATNAGGTAFRALETSQIQARNANANGSGTGFYALRGSTVNCRGATALNCAIGVYAGEGSNVNAPYVDCTGATTVGFDLFRGSHITANNAIGGLSQTALTVTANGIIYQ